MKEQMITRRTFVGGALAAGAALSIPAWGAEKESARMAEIDDLTVLPWAQNALEPFISARTISFHHGEHHRGYVRKLKQEVRGSVYEKLGNVEAIIAASAGNLETKSVYTNAVLAWNHMFYWHSMKPGGGGKPKGRVLRMIEKNYGSYDTFTYKFFEIAASEVHGWVWLAEKKNAIEIVRTGYIGSPLIEGHRPLACIDMWEHAFYLDYQNRVSDYVNAYTEHLLNWDFVAANLSKPG